MRFFFIFILIFLSLIPNSVNSYSFLSLCLPYNALTASFKESGKELRGIGFTSAGVYLLYLKPDNTQWDIIVLPNSSPSKACAVQSGVAFKWLIKEPPGNARP
jgi:hypothetical protein